MELSEDNGRSKSHPRLGVFGENGGCEENGGGFRIYFLFFAGKLRVFIRGVS